MKSSEKTKSKSDARRGKYAAELTVGEQELRERIAQGRLTGVISRTGWKQRGWSWLNSKMNAIRR